MEDYFYKNIISDHDVISCYYSNIIDGLEVEHVTTTTTTTSTATTFLDHDNKTKAAAAATVEESAKMSGQDLILKTNIANHPAFPHLLAASIQCHKVGAPPETASLLEEITSRENHIMALGLTTTTTTSTSGCSSQLLGVDPELDHFMESYSEILQRFKEKLSMTFNEATTFLSNIESQLSNLSQATYTKTLDEYHYSAGVNRLEKEMMSYGEGVEYNSNIEELGAENGEQELKEMLMRRYNGHLTLLKKEFLKRTKKVKLPKAAITALLQWWNAHYRWPYPTEEEKVKLSEETGLDQKQINNWFVNQRKRSWKPSPDIQFALLHGGS